MLLSMESYVKLIGFVCSVCKIKDKFDVKSTFDVRIRRLNSYLRLMPTALILAHATIKTLNQIWVFFKVSAAAT